MKNFSIFIPILILSILQSTIIPFNIITLLVLLWSSLRPAREGLLTAFTGGLILDAFIGRDLGKTSIFFLGISFLIYLYKRRFQASKLIFLLPFSLVILFIEDILSGQSIMVIRIGIRLGLIIILLPLLRLLSEILGDDQSKLAIGRHL